MADREFSLILRSISTIVLSFFLWTFGGLFDIAYAIKDNNQPSTISSQRSEKSTQQLAPSQQQTRRARPEEKFSRDMEAIEKILKDDKADHETKRQKIRSKKAKLDSDDVEIEKQFRETDEKIKDLPEVIKQRHRDFVRKYEENLNTLRYNLDDIDKAKTQTEKDLAQKKAKEFLEKVKPPKKHKTLDPNKLPHRTAEPIFKDPRAKREEFEKDSSQNSVARSQNEKKEKPILFASNGSLNGLISSKSSLLDSLRPSGGEGRYEGIDRKTHLLVRQGDPAPTLLALANPPTNADLVETIEVQFTSEIRAKAPELGHNPVNIYNWVRNNIEYIPTYGSIQGADMCLQTKQCNDMDTASLLIALLRVSGIHARYAYGTIELPIEKVQNWVGGFTDPNAALNFIATGGIPVTGLTSGGKISTVRMEHVWVEAYVKYIPYRGAVSGPGDTWIPLDASYKQYNYVNSVDTATAVPTDFDALLSEAANQSTLNNDIPSITNFPSEAVQNQVTTFQTTLNNYIATNVPQGDDYYVLNKTLHDYREITQKQLRFLPITLEGPKLVTKLNSFSEIPQSLRHKVSISVSSPDILLDNGPLSYTAYLPEVAGKKITLSYSPATPADAQVMSNAQGILNFPLYLVEVVPELKIEGKTVAAGGAIGMGQDQSLQIVFSDAHGRADQVNHVVQAGAYYSAGIDSNKVTFQYLYDRANRWQPDTAENRDDRLGELLHLISMFYYAKNDYFMDELAKTSNIISSRQPSESLVGLKFNANYLFDMPLTITAVGLNMDVGRDVVSAISKTNDTKTKFWFIVQAGIYSSGLEHSLFESLMGLDSISAIRFLDLASKQNVPIYVIDSGNSQRVDELNIPSQDKEDIRNFIDAGRTVFVPKSKIQYFDYSGVGYIALDTQTGAGAYMISGGYGGGETVKENVKALVDLAGDLIDNKVVVYPYKTTIENLLAQYPDIASSPSKEFKEWTEIVLLAGDCAKQLKGLDPRIKVIIGQQILYNIEIMLIMLTIP